MAPVTAYIGIGSNLDNPLRHAAAAISDIAALAGTRVTGRSRWYRSAPLGPPGQPDYINGVAAITTTLAAHQLLSALQDIENHHGRERAERWGPRTLDLDILLYGDQTIASTTLQVPHPRLTERNFVLYPLAELVPALILPDGTALTELLANVPSTGIVPLSPGD